MTHATLDPYQKGDSLLHRLDARVHLPLTLAFILVTALLPFSAWPAYILLTALVWAIALLSDLGIGYVLKRSLIALPFALAAIPVLFTIPGETLFSLGGWQISQPGAERLLSVLLKSWISVQAAILLAATHTLSELLLAMRALRLPRLLVSVMGLMWRYLYVMVEEAGRMMRAREARSAAPIGSARHLGGSLAFRARVTGGMAGSLLLRSFERSERVYAAMLARGYDGEVRSLPTPGVRAAHKTILWAGLLVLAGILFIGIIAGAG